jgi:prevent-host-death family protein
MPKALKKPASRVKPADASIVRTSGHDWQLQTAKAKFSEVFRRARTEGPQRITRQGKEGVVMISDEQYARLMVKSLSRKASFNSSGNRRS